MKREKRENEVHMVAMAKLQCRERERGWNEEVSEDRHSLYIVEGERKIKLRRKIERSK